LWCRPLTSTVLGGAAGSRNGFSPQGPRNWPLESAYEDSGYLVGDELGKLYKIK
jgi:hypothetical protein